MCDVRTAISYYVFLFSFCLWLPEKVLRSLCILQTVQYVADDIGGFRVRATNLPQFEAEKEDGFEKV